MRNKRRIAALLAMVMIASSLFTGPAEVRASELVSGSADEVLADEAVPADAYADVDADDEAPAAVVETGEGALVEDEAIAEMPEEGILTGTEDAIVQDSPDSLLSNDCSDAEAPVEKADIEDVSPDSFIEGESGMLLSANGGEFRNGDDTYELSRPTGYLNNSRLIPERDGYMFIGWYRDNNQQERVSISEYDYDLKYDDEEVREKFTGRILYAGWTRDFYTVTYDFGDGYIEDYNEEGEYDQLSEKSYKILSGNAVGAPNHWPRYVYIDDPYYTFKGYVTDKNSTETIDVFTWRPKGNVSEVTLYAFWVKDKYRVTFDANTRDGGYYYGNDEEGALIRVSQNEVIIGPDEDGAYSIDDYVPENDDARKAFAGWYLDPSCTKEPEWKDENKRKVKLTEDTVFYAKWTSTNKIISFDPNGGFFYDDEKEQKGYKIEIGSASGNRINKYLSNPVYDDLHIGFTGWYSDKECKNIVFEPGSKRTRISLDVTGDKTFYAGWKELYKVATFDAGDGIFGYYDPYTGEYKEGTTVSYRIDEWNQVERTPSTPVCNDKTKVFLGWFVDGVKVSPRYYSADEGVIFKARYSSYYEVTQNACGGWFDDEGITTHVVKVPQGLRVGETNDYYDCPEYPNDNVEFGGWYLDSEYKRGIGEIYDFIPTSDVTVYAKWLRTYSVSFVALDDSGNSYYSWPFSVPEGYKIKYCTGIPEIPQEGNRAFAGWFRDNRFTGKIDKDEIENTTVTGNMTFYARYANAFNVTFDANGGSFVSTSISNPYTVKIAEGDSIRGKVPTVRAKENTVFKGWFEDKACSREVEDLYNYPITGDKTLYAGFSQEYYTITFKTNNTDAIFENGEDTLSVNVVKGEPYRYGSVRSSYDYSCKAPVITTLSDNKLSLGTWSKNPDSSGNAYIFSGSTLNYTASTGETVTCGGKYGFIPTEDMTFYANWAEPVEITLHANGGYFRSNYGYEGKPGKDNTEWVITRPKGKMFSYSYPGHMYREGYSWDGVWYADASCTTKADFTKPLSDKMDLYAGWTSAGSGSGGGSGSSEYTYTLTLYAGDGFFDDDPIKKSDVFRTVLFKGGTWQRLPMPEISDDSKAFYTWCTDEACTKPLDENDIVRNATGLWQIRLHEKLPALYAKYGKAYKVTLNANGGYFDSGFSRRIDPGESMRNETVIRTKVLSGNEINIYDYTEGIRRDGNKIFGGWYLDKACRQKAVTYVDRSSYEFFKPESDVTLYAKWIDYEKASAVTISGNKTIKVGEKITLTANITPASAGNSQVTHWWIASQSITSAVYNVYRKYPAALKSDGTLIGQAPGSVTLYAEMNGIKSKAVTIKIEEKDDETYLSVTPEKLSLLFGETANLTATIKPVTTGGNIEWSSSDKTIADVVKGSSEITATVTAGKKAGTATITAKRGNKTATVTVEVAATPGVVLDKHEVSLISKAGSKIKLNATVTGKGYSVSALNWTSSNPAAATVSGGTVTAAVSLNEIATTVVKAETPDGKYFDTCKVTVRPPDMLEAPTASVAPGSVAKGTRVLLKAPIEGANIYYTTDGSNPAIGNDGKPAGTTKLYDDAIVIDNSMTIKALAVMSGYRTSPVNTFIYTAIQSWGDLTALEKSWFKTVDKVPSGIWYSFKGEQTWYEGGTTTKPTSVNKIYTGDKLTFDDEIRVFYGTERLVDGRDYTVSYRNNTNAADKNAAKAPTFTFKFKGNYTGKASFTFTISGADLSKAFVDTGFIVSIKAGSALSSVNPEVSYIVKGKNKKLTVNKDYDLTYYKAGTKVEPSTEAEAGTEYKLTITGHAGSCFVGKTNDIVIKTVNADTAKVMDMSEASVTDLTVPYEKNLSLESVMKKATVKIGNNTLVYGTGYTATPVDSTLNILALPAGDHAIILRGLSSNCVGYKLATLTVNGTKVTKVACLNLKPEYKGQTLTLTDLYKKDSTGFTTITPYITQNGKKVAVPASDYDADFSRLRAEGKSVVTFTMKNGYTGKITKTITVKRYNMKNDVYGLLDIKASNAAFCKNGAKPTVTVKFNGKTLKEGIDYKLTYTSNKKLSTDNKPAYVNVKGLGNFTGTAKVTFKVEKASLDNVILNAKDVKHNNKKDNYKTTVKLLDDGKAVPQSQIKFDKKTVKHYYADGANAGKEIPSETTVSAGSLIEARVTVTCPESSPYYGTADLVARYRVVDKSNWISSAKITFKDTDTFTFADGNEIIPLKKSDMTVTLKGVTLNESDYEIVSVTNNKLVGTAKVEIRGKGKYGGTKKQSFKIKKRK